VTDTTDLGTLDAQRLELLRRKIAERGLARRAVAADDDVSTDAREHPEMSDGQRRMWFVQSVDLDSALLNICVSYRVTGNVDVARLRQAVEVVAVRHPILRTTYQTDGDGNPYPVIRVDVRPGWAEHDLSGLAEQARRLRLEVLAQRQFAQPFDLTKDSPLRVAAARVSPDELILLLTAHHVAWDDGSWAPFFTDLTYAYIDSATATPPNKASDPLRSSDEDQAYWRSLMTDLPEPLELPGPNGSVVPSTWRAQRATARLSAETIERAAALARETGATPYMVLMAAFGALVHRYTHASA
jgi:mycobactin peptide synthetase MbtE